MHRRNFHRIDDMAIQIIEQHNKGLQIRNDIRTYNVTKRQLNTLLENLNYYTSVEATPEASFKVSMSVEVHKFASIIGDHPELKGILEKHKAEYAEINRKHPYPINAERLTDENYLERSNGITLLNQRTLEAITNII